MKRSQETNLFKLIYRWGTSQDGRRWSLLSHFYTFDGFYTEKLHTLVAHGYLVLFIFIFIHTSHFHPVGNFQTTPKRFHDLVCNADQSWTFRVTRWSYAGRWPLDFLPVLQHDLWMWSSKGLLIRTENLFAAKCSNFTNSARLQDRWGWPIYHVAAECWRKCGCYGA